MLTVHISFCTQMTLGKGGIIFYREGGRLSVMVGRRSPPLPTGENFGPPLWPHEKNSGPPKVQEHTPHISNGEGSD